MATKAIGKQQVVYIRVRTQNNVVVKRVDIVMPCPGALHPRCLKTRHTCGQQGPQHIVKQGVLHLKIKALRVIDLGR